MRQLKFQMAAQQKEDASLKDKTGEVSKMAQELSHFVDECMTKHASASILKVDHDEKKLEKVLAEVQGLQKTAERHVAGAKLAAKRFQTLLS